MTIFFSFDEIDKDCSSNPQKILDLFHYLITKKPVRKSWKIPNKTYSGSSFLLNPLPLLECTKSIDLLFILQYIRAASLRDYTLYKLYGVKYLPLEYYPDINIKNIRSNPLLTIEDNKLIFRFE